jgi:hypothetical protein
MVVKNQDFSPDFKNNQILNWLFQLLAANPTAIQGKAFVDTVNDAFKICVDGSTWETVAFLSDLASAGVTMEQVVDTFGNNVLVEGANISITYDDAANSGEGTITIALDPTGLNADTVDGQHAAGLLSRANHTGTQAPSTISFSATARLLGRSTAGAGTGEEVGFGGGIELNSGALRIAAFTGDVTKAAGGTATTIANDAVTNAKLANMAANTIKGNNTGSAADPKDLTVTELKALLALVAADISNFNTSVDGRITSQVTAAFINALSGVDADTLGGQDLTTLQNAIIAAIVDSAPSTLDTLNELAAALGDDPNFATTINTALAARNRTYTATYGNGTDSNYPIIHNLGTLAVVVSIIEVASGDEWDVPVTHDNVNQVTIKHSIVPTANQFRVTVQGRPD